MNSNFIEISRFIGGLFIGYCLMGLVWGFIDEFRHRNKDHNP